MKLRINKLISDAGLGSRRDVEEFIKAGRVRINGKRARLGDMVEATDVVLFDEVDLPVKDLMREHASLEKIQAREREQQGRPRTKDKAAERAESQRIKASPKSAALRKTSKNNPENKRLARLRRERMEEDEDLGFYQVRHKNPYKEQARPSKFGRHRHHHDD
ncbi:MAG: S4 domain-containing protein [Porphyromonadaceae bacterium]|nr:S4 domain-containing protein [Porphyromonadaceae bacterium]